MKRRRLNARRAKIHSTYDVAELARLFGVCRGTIRDWINRGMCPIQDGRRPALFLGDEVRRFLLAEQKARKRPTPPGQIYCFPCRMHRIPAGNEVDYRPRTATSGNLEGLCPECGRMLYRGVALAKLETIRGNLDVRYLDGDLRISTRRFPSLNPDSSE
jgi:hypothetical protein